MAKSNVLKQTMLTPEGINNYTGVSFRCFTKGDTLPFKFTFEDENGSPLDVEDIKVIVAFSSGIACDGATCNGDPTFVTVEVEIPLVDPTNGIFEGEVSDVHTQALPCGIVYGLVKYITKGYDGAEDASHIIDMCRLEVYPNILNVAH